MLIRVRLRDGKIEMVPPEELQELIAARKILQFRRSGRWATLGVDPLRSTIRGGYKGPERRKESRDE